MAQDAQIDARRHQAGARNLTFLENSEVKAPPITARTWLGHQASGTMASSHKQTLGGPIMSSVYQKMRKQLSGGKSSTEAGASTENETSGDKDNALGDLGKALGNAKP